MATRHLSGIPLPTDLAVDVRLTTQGLSVTVHGDVDLHTAGQLDQRLLEAVEEGERVIEVHLDDVSFLDSVGLGVLVAALKRQRSTGGTLELVCSQVQPLRLLRRTGLDRVFTVHP